MPRYTEHIKVPRWCGTVGDFADLALVAAGMLRQQSDDAEIPIELTVNFKRAGKADLVLPAELDEARRLGDGRRLKQADFTVGSGFSPPSIQVEAENVAWEPAVSVTIRGTAERDVLWLKQRLADELRAGRPAPNWYRRIMLAPLAALFLFGGEVQFLSGRIVEGIACIVLLALIGGLYAATPNLELLPTSGRSRWRRFARPILGAAVAIVLGLIGTAIYEAVRPG